MATGNCTEHRRNPCPECNEEHRHNYDTELLEACREMIGNPLAFDSVERRVLLTRLNERLGTVAPSRAPEPDSAPAGGDTSPGS